MTPFAQPPGAPAPTTPLGGKPRGVKAQRSDIEVYIRARYPLLYILTWEEQRACEQLDQVAKRLGKRCYQWTISGGVQRMRTAAGPSPTADERKGTKDPIAGLREILTASEPSIFVLKDFHSFLKDATVVRTLRDIIGSLHATQTSVVIMAPVLEVPPELEKDMTIIDFPLPGKADIADLLGKIAHDVHSNAQLNVSTDPADIAAMSDAAIGLTMTEIENVFAKVLVTTNSLTKEQTPLIYQEKQQIIRKSGLLEYYEVSDDLASVGGLENLKTWLGKRQLAFTEEARAFGLPAPKGVLFLGVQGCGKSLVAKACSSLWRMPLLKLDMGQLFGSYIGESEANVRRAIKVAESIAPVILWIDEIDKGMAGMKGADSGDSGTTARVLGTIVTWLQEKTDPVFVIATANDITRLPPELIRKGRFDEIFFVDLPSESERQEIFRVHLEKRGRPLPEADLQILAQVSADFSGAEIEQAIISAMFDAFEQRGEITRERLQASVQGTAPLAVTMREDIKGLRDWAKGRATPASLG